MPRNALRFRFTFGLLLLLLAFGTAIPETTPLYTRPAENPDFLAAMRDFDGGYYDRAADALQRLALINRGTPLGANSAFNLAGVLAAQGRDGDAKAEYTGITRDYPNSEFDIMARQMLLRFHRPIEDQAGAEQDLDDLLRRFGAPTLSEIGQGGSSDRIRALPEAIQHGLVSVYIEMHALLGIQSARYDEALRLAEFGREAFPFDDGWAQRMQDDLLSKRYGPDGVPPGAAEPVTISDPVIRLVQPRPDQRKGSRPKIKVEIAGGDWAQPQIALSTIRFTLDGQDLMPFTRVRSRINPSLKRGQIFERLELSARPSSPLTAGVHTVEVQAHVNGYESGPGSARVSIQFSVVPGQKDDPEDERVYD